jgi:hypothetical protein
VPPYDYPYPDPNYPYPTPRTRSILVARYDSPYYYCDDLSGGQYVNGSAVVIAKPKRIYAPTPVYKDGRLSGWRDLGAKDYLADRNADSSDYRVHERDAADAALDTAVSAIRQSWLKSDVEPLARIVRKDAPIAIILQGKYVYTLEAGDFLEVSRAAYSSGSGLQFIVDHLHRRADNIYSVTGRHIYYDKIGIEHTVFFSYVLEKVQGEYTITQVASAINQE